MKSFMTYTHYGYIRTTVNVSVLVVLIFSQNFSTNGPCVVLNFCKFSNYTVLFFEKKSYTAYYKEICSDLVFCVNLGLLILSFL